MKKIGGGVTMYDSAITEENQANLKTKPSPFLVRVCFSGGPTNYQESRWPAWSMSFKTTYLEFNPI